MQTSHRAATKRVNAAKANDIEVCPDCVTKRANEANANDIKFCRNCVTKRANEAEIKSEVTRYIPAKVRQLIQVRSGGKCEFPSCNYPPEIYHHTRRFALKKNHDPTFIRALCKKHEGILQAGLITNEEGDPSTWNIRNAPEWWDMKNIIDAKVAAFRQEPQLEPGG